MPLWTNADSAAGKPKWLSTDEKAKTYGVDVAEAQAAAGDNNPVTHPGWVRRVVKTGYVTDLAVGATGADYPDGTGSLEFTGGGGSGAAGYYVAEDGEVVSAVLTAPGAGYTSAPTITVVADIYQTGGVTGVEIGDGGTGYDSATGVALQFTGGGGTGAAGYVNIATGVVEAAVITNEGSGYTFAPTVSFTSGTGGTGAELTALLSTGAGATGGTDGEVTAVMSDSVGRILSETLVAMGTIGADTGGGDDSIYPDT